MDINKLSLKIAIKSLKNKKTVRSMVKKYGYKPIYKKIIRILKEYFRCRYFIKKYFDIKKEKDVFEKFVSLKEEGLNLLEFQNKFGKNICQKYSFPNIFVKELMKILRNKKILVDFLKVLNFDSNTFIRINTIKSEKNLVREVIEKYLDLEETNIPNLFKVTKVKNRRIFDLIKNMYITTTDYSSLKSVFVLSNFIKEYFGESREVRVLDACSSPGAKITYLYELNKNIKITCIEKDKLRYFELIKNLNKYGVKLKALNEDFLKIKKKNYFDVIILDVPCSNSGTVGKFPEVRYFYRKKEIKDISFYQKKLLTHAINLNPSVVFYSTCSLFYSENIEVLKELKEKFNALKIKDKDLMHFDIGYLVDIRRTKSIGFFFTILYK